MEHSTIAAISTAQGAGGIGVIRISGKDALIVAQKVFRAANGKKVEDMQGYTASFGYIYQEDEKIDEGVLLVYRAPHSYTGEHVAEISCHGGLYVTKSVLRAVFAAGAAPAQAGEFTQRAFLNGKLDLTEAEAVMDIISAKGKSAARAALACKEGALSRRIEAVCGVLSASAAHLSAWADYPEEDIPEVSRDTLRNDLQDCEKNLQDLLNRYDAGRVMRDGIDTLIAGKPNVGKSTLMNLLSGCDRSIVTDIPGTTRDIIEETVMLGSVQLRLSDTAGLRSTDNPVEKIGVERTKERMKSCGLVLAVFDASSPLSEEDTQLLELLRDAPAIAVINKADLERQIDQAEIEKRVPHIVTICAAKGTGLDELSAAVEKVTGTQDFQPSDGILATERQKKSAEQAVCAIRDALTALEAGMTLDAVTVSIEEAVGKLLELTGKRAGEEIIHQVFSRFCVGK